MASKERSATPTTKVYLIRDELTWAYEAATVAAEPRSFRLEAEGDRWTHVADAPDGTWIYKRETK